MPIYLALPIFIACLGGLSATLYFGQRAMREILGSSDTRTTNSIYFIYPAILKASAILAVMAVSSAPALLRDSAYSMSTFILVSAIAFAGFKMQDKTGAKFSKDLLSTYLLFIAFAITLPLIATAYVPDFKFGSWLIFTAAIAFGLEYFLIQSQVNRKASFIKCVTLLKDYEIFGNKTLQIVVMLVSVALAALFGFGAGEVSDNVLITLHMSQAAFGLVFAAVLFFPETLAAVKLVKAGKIQSALIVVFLAILSTLLVTVPTVAGLCYELDIENITVLSDMQAFFVLLTLGVSYLICSDHEITPLECQLLGGIATCVIATSVLF